MPHRHGISCVLLYPPLERNYKFAKVRVRSTRDILTLSIGERLCLPSRLRGGLWVELHHKDAGTMSAKSAMYGDRFRSSTIVDQTLETERGGVVVKVDGAKLAAARERVFMSQEELAESIGMNPASGHKIGDRKPDRDQGEPRRGSHADPLRREVGVDKLP